MKLRHRIIRWLSFGDFILMNAQIDSGGVFRSRNAGPMVMSRLDAWCWDRDFAIGIGSDHMNAGVQVQTYGKQGILIEDCYFNGMSPAGRSILDGGREP